MVRQWVQASVLFRLRTLSQRWVSLDTLISTTIPGINTTINNNLATSRNELTAEKATLNTDISVAKADAKKANDDLAAEVTRAKGTEGAITTTVTNLTTTVNGHTTTISENFTSLTNKDTALANRATNLETTVNSTTDGNSALKARIAVEETARANADSAVATRTTKLEVASRGAGNLLGNTEFTTTTGWAVPHNGAGLNPLETQTGDYWNPRGETVLRLFSTNTPPVGSYTQVISDAFAVVPASWIQFYAYTSSHRAKSWTTLFFYDLNGAEVAYAGEIYGARINAGGPDLNGWDITGVKAFKVPATAVSARFAWRVYDNGVSNPVAWFFHPYVGAAKEGQTEWNPYSPGSGKQTFVQTNARIGTEETARANADSALAARATTLESTVNSGTDGNAALKSRIATEETTRSTADSTLALRATTLESRAKRTEGFASGDLIRKGTFEDGNPGDWTGGASAFKPVDYNQPVPPSGQYVLLIRGVRDCFEGLEWISGAWGGRKLRVSGYASGQFSPTNSAAGVMIRRADGSVTWIGVRAANRYTAGYNRFDQTISLPPETVAVRPWMQNDGDAASTPDMEVRLHSLSIRDVTVAEEAISKVTEEAGARATADSALATRSTTLESQMTGATASGLQTMVKNNRKNLADVGWWKKGAAIPWALNGGQRNEIVQFPHGSNFGGLAMPDGSSGDAWLCQADGSGQNAGGWNSGPIAPLDPDKTYRFSVPIAALDPVGARSSYWGTGNVCHLNTTTGADNPYFAYGSVTPGKWYLFTGFIFPRNSVDMTHDGAGIYDILTGERVAGGWNYCFHPAGYQPIHRAYQFYATNGAYQAFGRPMVELVDGTETPFNAMLGAVRSANARITAEEGVRATADSALATRATNLESTVNSGTDGNSALKARIAVEETTRASAVSSVAGRTTVVEAQVSTEASNMLRNGIFNSPGWVGRGAGGIPPYWNGWSQDNGAFLGASPRDSRYGAPAPLQIDRNGINNGITQPIFNVAPGWYAFEVDITGEDGNWSGSGVHCNFNNGYAFNFGFATNADTAGRVGDIGTANRQFTWLFYNGANTGNANLYLMSGWSGFQGGTNFGFFRGVWHRVVMRAATAGEILAQKVNNDLNGPSGAIARIAAEETARANAVSAVASRTSTVETSLNGLGSRVSTAEGSITTLNGRSSSYWQAVAVAGNNRAQITVRSDSNGGAGVDIVGDVTFAGNLNVKSASSGVRTEYTNTGIKTYNANGVLVFQSGIY
ncbi:MULTISPECIES: hypothetical protein [unclassified Sphingomonas]|uniref:hypothetical protein n=1 Tax=unclassified Sphingomonas TaxID=196159 RepID=UPI0012E1DD2E|nr:MULTISPECIES: hypothetical protein [unclassified Sphingomonas]